MIIFNLGVFYKTRQILVLVVLVAEFRAFFGEYVHYITDKTINFVMWVDIYWLKSILFIPSKTKFWGI